MKAAVDNITLIDAFLKGDDSLLANREMRVEKVRDETQLLTTQGILLAKGRIKSRLPSIVVRLQSDYWELIHQLALKASLIPLQIQQAQLEKAAFAQYDYHSVPAGYQIHCQEASAFWKTWWINHRKLQLMDLLLLYNKRWYPVNQMQCETGTIYVKTWRGEKTFSITDTVIWLDRNTHEQRQRRQAQKPAQIKSLRKKPLANQTTDHPAIPDDLRQVIQASSNRLIVHTVLGPVIIEGQNLTCMLARKAARVP
ncbi:MAG: hypothetical protein ACFB2W_03585 [Leptolyngbyaceae cyanobacterium]